MSLRSALGWTAGGVAVALAVAYWVVLFVDTPGDFAFDFRQFWQGGRDVFEGASPYPDAPSLEGLHEDLGPVAIQDVFRFPYPAFAAVALAPFGAIGFGVASWLWAGILVAAISAALWIVGVRDWRVGAVVATAIPVLSAVRLGTLTPLLVLALAILWRWRDRRWVAGGSLAVAISLKLFLWPLVVWLAATRRIAAAGVALAGALGLTVVSWAAIGFEGLADYPELVRRLADAVEGRGFSLVALGLEAGASEAAAAALPWVVGLTLLLAAVLVARRPDGELLSFTLTVVAAIALTPIVWLHYFALLIVPLAIALPRVGWGWAILWGFWLIPASGNEGELWRIALALGLVVSLVVAVAGAEGSPQSGRAGEGRRRGGSPGLSKASVTTESGG